MYVGSCLLKEQVPRWKFLNVTLLFFRIKIHTCIHICTLQLHMYQSCKNLSSKSILLDLCDSRFKIQIVFNHVKDMGIFFPVNFIEGLQIIKHEL